MGRTALITGAVAGIGRACSLELAKQGIAIGVLGRNIDECNNVVLKIRENGGRAMSLRADVTDRIQVDSAIRNLRETFGPITILVNNAGVSGFKEFSQLTELDWAEMFSVNVIGTFIVTQSCLKDMILAQWGRIINISSSSAQSGSARQVHYAASKGAVISMTKSLALELGHLGITVNNIPPGSVQNTKLWEKNKERFGLEAEELAKWLPVGRVGLPEDVAAACAWLASEESGYITGQTINVNGGRIMT